MAAGIIAALAGAPCLAQSWVRQTPLPTNRGLYSVAFTSPTHGFVVAGNGTVCETSDGGETWTTRFQQPYSTDPMYKIVFADELHGYITGNPGGAFNKRTSDGGVTWLPMSNLNLGSTYDIDFVTPTTGFASPGGFAVGFTSDGGATWENRLHSPEIKWFGMDFLDQTTGLVAGYEFYSQPEVIGIFKTTDGGSTFARVHDRAGFPFWISSTEAIAFEVDSDYFMQTASVVTHRSFDGGQTWTQWATWPLADYDSFYKMAHAGGDVYCGVNATGTVYRTDNAGVTWQKVYEGLGIPFIANVWADISFLDAQHGWSVNSSGVVVATDDGGQSWRVISQGVGGDVAGLGFHPSGFGVAACGGQIVEVTLDGGRTWEPRRIKTLGNQFGFSESTQTVFVLDSDSAFVGGQGGLLYRTDDAGESWQNIGYLGAGNFPVWVDAADIEFSDGFDGWVASSDGVFRTTDGGFTWNQIPEPVPGWALIGGAIELEGESSVFVLPAGSSIVWRSIDGGQTWDNSEINEGFLQLHDISFATPLVGFAAGTRGGGVGWDAYIGKTVDGGVTWTLSYTSAATVSYKPHHVFDVEAISPTFIRALAVESDRTVVITSTNGGQTWTRDVHPTIIFPENLDNLAATADGSVWIGGFRGIIEHKPGVVACRPDMTTTAIAGSPGYGAPNGIVNNDDFFYYLAQFAAGNAAKADLTTTALPGTMGYGVPNGVLNNDDFFYYLAIFAAGC